MAATLLVPLVALGSGAAFAAARSGAAPTWHLEDAAPPLGTYLGTAACPSATRCLLGASTASGGGVILSSSDAGATYASIELPPNTPGVNGVACPSVSVCYAVTSTEQSPSGFTTISGYQVLKSTDGGSSWTTVDEDTSGEQLFGSGAQLLAISCPTTTWCMAVGPGELLDATVLVTSDGGASWTEVSPFGPDNATVTLQSVSCPSPGTCVAVGQDAFFAPVAVATTDGGITWDPLTLPDDPSDVMSVDCTTVTDCLAVATGSSDDDLYATTDLGATWTQVTAAGAADLAQVTCVDANDCLVVGSTSSGSTSIGVALTTTDGGSTWTPLVVPKVATLINSASCATPTSCTFQAVNASDVDLTLRLRSGRVVPSTHPYETGVVALEDAACPTPSTCVAVVDLATPTGQVTAVSTTSGIGGPWGPDVTLPGADDLEAFACPATSLCVAAVFDTRSFPERSYLDVSRDGGRQWAPRLELLGGFYSLSCPTATSCIAVTTSGFARTTDAGATWTHVVLPKGAYVGDVSCSSTRVCLAVGGLDKESALFRTTDGGATWAPVHLFVPSTGSLDAVACASAGRCAVVGATSNQVEPASPYLAVTSDGGGHWQRRPFEGLDDADDAACTASGACLAVGLTSSLAEGLASSDDAGTAWSATPLPNDGTPLGLSCGAHVCVLASAGADGSTTLEAWW